MTYQPFLIGNYQTGLDEELPIWLLPDDAFSVLNNAYLERGTIKKRLGYRKLFTMRHILSGPTSAITGISMSNMATVTAPAHGLVDGTLLQISGVVGMTQVNWNGPNTYKANVLTADTFQLRNLDNTFVDSSKYPAYTAGGTITPSLTVVSATATNPMVVTTSTNHGLNNGAIVAFFGATGTAGLNNREFAISNVTPTTFQIAFNGTASGTYAGNAVVTQSFNLPIVGLIKFADTTGKENLLICDTRRICLYDKSSNAIVPLGNSDLFSGGIGDYFKSANFGVNTYLTNNVDNILQYNFESGVLQFIKPQYGPNATDVIQTCSDVFELRDRIVLLRPTYQGTYSGNQPQRLAYSAINDTLGPMAWRQDVSGYGGYVDAPTGENLQCGIEFRDTLIVGFDKSLWRIRALPNINLPYVFERIDTVSGSYSRTCMAANQDAVLGLGDNGIFGTNGATAQRMDTKIPLFVYDKIDQNQRGLIYCFRNNFTRQIWWLYPSTVTESQNASCLVYHELYNSYATYDISLSVLQRFPYTQGLRLSDFDLDRNLDVTFETVDPDLQLDDAIFNESGDEFLGGGYDGNIYGLESGSNDDTAPIEMRIKSRHWNPYVNQAKNARLGYVDLILSCEVSQQFEVSFYTNGSEKPYAVRTVQVDYDDVYKRQVKRVFAGGTGSFHQMQIYQAADMAPFSLESTIAYFAPVPGRIR